MYFASFWQNNNIFMQNDCGLKKILLAKKFIFQQIVIEIANRADIRWNNSLFTNTTSTNNFKTIVARNREFYQFFDKLVAYLRIKSCIFKKSATRKNYNSSVNLEFFRFLEKEWRAYAKWPRFYKILAAKEKKEKSS